MGKFRSAGFSALIVVVASASCRHAAAFSPPGRVTTQLHQPRVVGRVVPLPTKQWREGPVRGNEAACKLRPSTSLSAAAAAGTAAVAATATAVAAIPSLKSVALACLLPTLLGYYKSEYGVSYAYGTAVATSAFLVLRSLPAAATLPFPSTLAACHASAVFFYGIRLNVFLLYRELFVPRFAKMRERIEERAIKRGSRLSRTPFILSCAALYGAMAAPLLVTRRLCESVPLGLQHEGWARMALQVTVLVAWAGFLLGAIGDAAKSISKLLNGDDHLVTGGVFSMFRHPNYTGEVFGWTGNCVAPFFAVLSAGGGWPLWKRYAPYLLSGVFGALGIVFVLGAATTNLEQRQKEQYGDTQKYKDWVQRSWVGFQFGANSSNSKAKPDATEGEHGIELKIEDEDDGSGI